MMRLVLDRIPVVSRHPPPLMTLGEEQIKAMKVVELKAELAQRGLPVAGRKEDLVNRLLGVLSPKNGPPDSPGKKPDLSGKPKDSPPLQARTGAVKTTNDPKGPPSMLDEASKRTARAARFNLGPSETDRKLRRVERFGVASDLLLADDISKLRQRQSRFGVTTSKTLVRTELEESKLRRLQRFGLSK